MQNLRVRRSSGQLPPKHDLLTPSDIPLWWPHRTHLTALQRWDCWLDGSVIRSVIQSPIIYSTDTYCMLTKRQALVLEPCKRLMG